MALGTFKAEVNGIIARLSRLPPKERLSTLSKELESISDPDEREAALNLVAVAVDLSKGSESMKTWEKVTMISAGGFGVSILLLIALLVPDPTNFQFFVFRIVLALAAAAFGCGIPGFFHLEGKVATWTLRAGGALSLFVLIYNVNPPMLVHDEAAKARSPIPAVSPVPQASTPP